MKNKLFVYKNTKTGEYLTKVFLSPDSNKRRDSKFIDDAEKFQTSLYWSSPWMHDYERIEFESELIRIRKLKLEKIKTKIGKWTLML